jgi:precorrin-6B C5,15-methyltransferase / cobalt-precorrin-6B C5,C15-methyltransferase
MLWREGFDKMASWISVIGFGEDGMDGLTHDAQGLVQKAEVLVGGERHLAKVPPSGAERISWGKGFSETLDQIEKRRGKRVVVLASGDPLNFGAGTVLAKRFSPDDLLMLPSPSAFSLAAARMCWPLPETECVTLHGRAIENLNRYLFPDAKLLILSRDGETPSKVANLLAMRGFEKSSMVVLEHMGADEENRIEGLAESWGQKRCADLNVIAVSCVAGPRAKPLSPMPGLCDDVFENDGQLTKSHVRAATLAALAPFPGHVLWDVGAGCGSVSIEWMRAQKGAMALAIESRADRCAMIARNAALLGTPNLKVIEGVAPDIFSDLEGPSPDAIFVGGGASKDGLLSSCWDHLSSSGRLVVNVVTLEAEAKLLEFHKICGGELVRIAISKAEPIGRLHTFRPMMPVLQLVAQKS